MLHDSGPNPIGATLGGPTAAGALPAEGASNELRSVPFRTLLFWSLVVGTFGGLAACAYALLLDGAQHLVWSWGANHLVPLLPRPLQERHWLWLATAAGGALVGISLKLLGTPGEISAVVNNIHMEGGRIDAKQTPSMIAASLISITFGGSAGPEAPLVQIEGSFGSWLGERLRLSPELVRTLTFCGMASALGAFFGAPVGGALFALEIPHRRGLEYYEALVPAVTASLVSYLIFRGLMHLPLTPLYQIPAFELTLRACLQAGLCGLAGAATATLFVLLFRALEHAARPLEHRPILLGALGGAAIGLIAVAYPQTLFFGEHQGKELIESGLTLGVTALFGLALAKMLAVGCTLHAGFRGGFIFPLFFIGGAVGLALHLLFPGIPVSLAALCTMAAVNVAVTKTPVSTPVILTTLSGLHALPALAVASFGSFLLTTRVAMIRTQRSRREVEAGYRPA